MGKNGSFFLQFEALQIWLYMRTCLQFSFFILLSLKTNILRQKRVINDKNLTEIFLVHNYPLIVWLKSLYMSGIMDFTTFIGPAVCRRTKLIMCENELFLAVFPNVLTIKLTSMNQPPLIIVHFFPTIDHSLSSQPRLKDNVVPSLFPIQKYFINHLFTFWTFFQFFMLTTVDTPIR